MGAATKTRAIVSMKQINVEDYYRQTHCYDNSSHIRGRFFGLKYWSDHARERQARQSANLQAGVISPVDTVIEPPTSPD